MRKKLLILLTIAALALSACGTNNYSKKKTKESVKIICEI